MLAILPLTVLGQDQTVEYEYYYEDDPSTVIQPQQIQSSVRAAAVQAVAQQQHQPAAAFPARPAVGVQAQPAVQARPAVPLNAAPARASPAPAQFTAFQAAAPAPAPARPQAAAPAPARPQAAAPAPARAAAPPAQASLPVKGREPATADQPKPEPIHIVEQINE